MKSFEESGPGDMPEPRGKGFRIVVYVDCDLGGDCVTPQVADRVCSLSERCAPVMDVQEAE